MRLWRCRYPDVSTDFEEMLLVFGFVSLSSLEPPAEQLVHREKRGYHQPMAQQLDCEFRDRCEIKYTYIQEHRLQNQFLHAQQRCLEQQMFFCEFLPKIRVQLFLNGVLLANGSEPR